MFLTRTASKAVTQNVAAEKEVITASVSMGNTKAHRIVGKTLRATVCVKRSKLLRARVWIHFECNCFEQQQQQQQHVQQ